MSDKTKDNNDSNDSAPDLNQIEMNVNNFNFEVYMLKEHPIPMVVLPLTAFLTITNALLLLNVAVKDEFIMDLNSKIQTKLANIDNLDIKYKDASLKDNLEMILKLARCESSQKQETQV